MDRVFLIGPMGSGKTTVGRRLARRLGWDFRDSDHEIETRTGVSIPVIFEHEGEAGFRGRESRMIDELTQCPRIVLATGGGAILDPHNREFLHRRGWVVFLACPVERQYQRTRRDRNRPLLQTEDPKAKLTALYAVREPLYRETAHYVLDTQARPVTALVEELALQIERQAQ